jgi:predicted MPP superfamily phosphohydrolase
MNRRRGAAFVLLLVFCLWLWWGNTAIEVTRVEIVKERLPRNFDGFCIAHLSDLHNAEFGDGQKDLLRLVEEMEPDVIALTGDLIDSKNSDPRKVEPWIRDLVALAPVLFVTGNHEAWTSETGELRQILESSGVHWLDGRNFIVERREEAIQILGLADPETFAGDSYEKEGAFLASLEKLVEEKAPFRILLSHRPEFFEQYTEREIDLVLCGHAHGGQIRIPFVGGLVAPNQGFFPKYSEGLHHSGKTTMAISRGLGNSVLPLRVNNRPEILEITLRSGE